MTEIAPTLKLAEPFPEADIEWRIQRSGIKNGKPWAMCLAYITNRAIMDRLDAVLGPENWRNEFVPWGDKAVACGLSLRLSGEWITKWDGAEQTDVESVKGGFSAAMKRAAVQWGIGRYLYNLEEGWAVVGEGPYSALIKETKDDKGTWYKWAPPKLPGWALPKNGQPPKMQAAQPVGPPTAKELTEVPVPLRAPEPMPWDGTEPRPAGISTDGEVLDEGPTRDTAYPGPGPTHGKTVKEWAKNQLVAAEASSKLPEEWRAVVRSELKARSFIAAAKK